MSSLAPKKKLLVIDVAALGWNLVSDQAEFQPAQTVFPAVTCTVQASFRTASLPGQHGMVGNGLYFRDLRKVLFWEQASSLVQGPRIWEEFRQKGGKVGMMFWQQAMGEEVDLVVTPRPIHKHSGGMIQSCYTRPAHLEERLNEAIGRPFNLMNYWGPFANHKSTDWIVDATIATMRDKEFSPDLLLTYLPHLDYDLQRYGPGSEQGRQALSLLEGYLHTLKEACEECGYDWLIFGDYAIEPVRRGAVFPNRRLREAGLVGIHDVRGMAYVDFNTSRAFAVVDHQVAHVFCRDGESIEAARQALSDLPGVASVLDKEAQKQHGVAHTNAGDLVLIADNGAWFAYPWFEDKAEAPDYAGHVDIHNKPGYDPCELFLGWPPGTVSFNTKKIRGSHGNIGENFEIAWSSSLQFDEKPGTLLDLVDRVVKWMAGAR